MCNRDSFAKKKSLFEFFNTWNFVAQGLLEIHVWPSLKKTLFWKKTLVWKKSPKRSWATKFQLLNLIFFVLSWHCIVNKEQAEFMHPCLIAKSERGRENVKAKNPTTHSASTEGQFRRMFWPVLLLKYWNMSTVQTFRHLRMYIQKHISKHNSS